MNIRRFAAIAAIFALVALYITTFIIALCDFPGSDRILAGFIMLDIAVPVMAWIFMQLHKYFGPKK